MFKLIRSTAARLPKRLVRPTISTAALNSNHLYVADFQQRKKMSFPSPSSFSEKKEAGIIKASASHEY